jgi:hypothetical protein
VRDARNVVEIDMVRRALILAAALVGVSWTASFACDTPFPNRAFVRYGELNITFATDRLSYAIGDSVKFFLSIENTGSEPFSFHSAYHPQEAFLVVADSCLTNHVSNCVGGWQFQFPWLIAWSEVTLVIPPGGCQVWSRTWSGRNTYTHQLPPPGLYAALGALHDDSGSLVVPPGGARLSLVIGATGGVPDRRSTWSDMKTRYER